MQQVLTALKDIPGVVGSFVLTPQGALAGREMPAIYPDEAFPELGRRLATISEVLDSQMGAARELLMKFEGYWLFVRHTTNCLLSVLVAESVNFPALRMATNVALKQITEHVGANPPPLPTAVAAAPAATPAPAEAPAAAPEAAAAPAKHRRFFRGQWLD
jgi:hypothetical protein